MKPLGGTELQHAFLEKYVSKDVLDKFQICTSIPGKVPIDPKKINILWQKNSWNQPNIEPWFTKKSNHDLYDYYVFNSHWNYEKFRMCFDIPTHKCTVIKNGIPKIKLRDVNKKSDKTRLIFTPTPWRGLNVLLAAMQLIKSKNIVCDVYSSTSIYGDKFKEANDKQFQGLYEQCRQLPNVNYIGYKPHDYILEHLHEYDAFVYPNVWEETFCISALEALAAGLYTVTTDYGALFETCAEFPVYVPFDTDYDRLAEQFAFAIDLIPQHLQQQGCRDHLKFQQKYFNYFYSWDRVAPNWINFLNGALNARSK